MFADMADLPEPPKTDREARRRKPLKSKAKVSMAGMDAN